MSAVITEPDLNYTEEEVSMIFIKLNMSLIRDPDTLFYITTPPKEGVTIRDNGYLVQITNVIIKKSKHPPYKVLSFRTKCGTTFSPPIKYVKKIRTSKGEVLTMED